MEIFGNARLKIGSSILEKRIGKTNRKVYYSSISQVKSIGIVWDASKVEDFNSLSKFFFNMHERNIDVKIISYYPGKELPDQFTAIRFLSCIRKKEVNVFFIPESAESDFFIKNHFDVIIDINFDRVFPLKYITALSVSPFKVGLYEPDSDQCRFDLMIDMKKNVRVESYLNEVIRYLEMINSGSAAGSNKN
jgi:hypothetical protein